MTPAEFWNGDVCLARYYRKAHELKKQERNQEMWMQGMYFYDAICRASPILRAFAKSGTKPEPYLEEPYPLLYKELKKKEADKEKARYEKNMSRFSTWANAINAARKEGKNDGRECN